MKKLVLLSALSFIFCKSFSQSIMLSNGSVSLKIIPVKCFNGDVKGFTFELSNNSYNKIYTGINQSEKVICYIYKVGNMLLILCGGVPPGLYDFHPKSLNLYPIIKGDTLKFQSRIYQQYKGEIVITNLEFIKLRKVVNFDYLTVTNQMLFNRNDYDFSKFMRNKNRLSFEVNP